MPLFVRTTQAGWRLHASYGRQFDKLLSFVATDFVPRLVAGGVVGAAAVATRLRLLTDGGAGDVRARGPHPSRELPQRDVSSSLKGL